MTAPEPSHLDATQHRDLDPPTAKHAQVTDLEGKKLMRQKCDRDAPAPAIMRHFWRRAGRLRAGSPFRAAWEANALA